MKKINENTKVTLTLKQLRQLVKESLRKLSDDGNVYVAKINPAFMEKEFDICNKDMYAALKQVFGANPGKKTWTALETFQFDISDFEWNSPTSIHAAVKNATKAAQEYEKTNPNDYLVVFHMGAIRLNVMWKSQYLEGLETREEEDDADVITDADFAEVVDELEYYLLDNEGCADLKDDSGIEKFRDKVVYPAVNAFFNAGKTVEDKEEIMDFVKGHPNPYKFYRDKDPYEDG